MKIYTGFIVMICVVAYSLASCSLNGKKGLFASKTVREKYEEKVIKDSGKNNPIVNSWLNAAAVSLKNPIVITNNFKETGTFLYNDSNATAYLVNIKKGQKISVQLNKLNGTSYNVYMDLWKATDTLSQKLPSFLMAADTSNNLLQYIAENNEQLIIRFQHNLATTGTYELDVATGPSFFFPIDNAVKSNIGSLWGDGRDGGARKHEGIDIFAPKKSPAVAVADGVITSVTENVLGGKVVFMQPNGMRYNVYYAHLDSQLVEQGQKVVAGQAIGLVGNTGNARTTPAHLHFGIYGFGGAIDPLLFVKPIVTTKKQTQTLPQKTNFITLRSAKLLKDLSLKMGDIVLPKNTTIVLRAVADNYYKVITRDGKSGFIAKADVKAVS